MMPIRLSLQSLSNDRAFAEARLAAAPVGGWGTERLIWQNRLADIDSEVATLNDAVNNTASVALVFSGHPVTGETQIRLDFAADALGAFQRIVSANMAAQRGGPQGARGRVRGADQAKLYIRELVRGSVGFLLEEQPSLQQDLLPSPLKNAVEGTAVLVSDLGDAGDEQFETTVRSTAPRVLQAVKSFAKVLATAGATARISADRTEVTLGTNQVSILFQRLEEISVDERTDLLDGTLLGVFPESHQFEFQQPGNVEALHGSISDELAERYRSDLAARDAMLMHPVRASIRIVESRRHARLIGQQAILEDIMPITSDET